MKFLLLVSMVVVLSADGESVPVEQDTRREDLLAQCLVQILSKALYKTDAAPLHPECKNILKPGHTSVVKKSEDAALKTAQEDVKRPSGESEVNEEVTLEDLLKAEKEKHDELNNERSQEDFPSFVKRRLKERREEMGNERSQEDFPSFVKRRLKDKREEQDDERSQEDFPSYYKRSSNDKREDPEDERSQEEFPQKRHFSILHKEKRDNPDEERSQEEFPPYQYKRSRLLSSKDKREDTDYDRSQEDFPRGRNQGDEEEKEEDEREKQIWKPSHRYHHKKMLHKRDEDSENENLEDQDYDRSQEDFPNYTRKRNHVDEDDEEDKEEREKHIWKPSHRYHHKKKLNKQNGYSAEDMKSESEGVDADFVKRSRKPSSRNHHKKYHKRSGDSSEEDYEEQPHRYPPKHNHKLGDFMDFENEDEPKIAHELNEKRHPSNSQGEEDEQKRHQSTAEEEQDKEAALRYLTKKKNELEERLLNKVEFDEKSSPWIYRGSQYVSTGPHYNRNLEEIAETLRYKRGLLSQEESLEEKKDVPH